LCVGYLGEHLEDIIDDIHEIAPAFPVEVKVTILHLEHFFPIKNCTCFGLRTHASEYHANLHSKVQQILEL
jgi:hypothetical protein